MASLDEIDKRYFLMVTPSHEIGSVQTADISKSCDICGEGKSYGRKYRMHLYIKDSYENSSISCFNCNYSGNMYSYLKDYHPSEYTLYKKEKGGSSFKELILSKDIEKVSTIDDFDTEIDSSDSNIILPKLIPPLQGFTELPIKAINYIKGRGLEPKDNWLYSPKDNKVLFNNKEILLSDFLIVPLTFNNQWYGFQAIGWNRKVFFVYLVDGNSSWKVWNYDKIDRNKEVYIFESIYDAMSSGETNVIAQLGANLHNDRIQELKHPVFCLDNQNIDDASYRETLKYLELNYKCFIWPKKVPNTIKDFNDLRKKLVPYNKIKSLLHSNIHEGMKGILYIKTL